MAAIQAVLATFHIAAAGLAAVGPLLVASLRLRKPCRSDNSADNSLRQLAWAALFALLAAAAVGFIVGAWRLWTDPEYAAMLARFSRRSYELLAAEWFFSLICYGIWLALWSRWREKPWRHAVIAWVGATNLLYHFPPLMTAQNLLAAEPSLVAEQQISRPDVLVVMRSPVVLAKTAHIWGASLLVAAISLLLSIVQRDSTACCALIRVGVWVALVGVVAQWLSGIVTVALLPAEAARRLIAQPGAAILMVLSVLTSTYLLQQLVSATLCSVASIRPRRLAWITSIAMLLMSLAARW